MTGKTEQLRPEASDARLELPGARFVAVTRRYHWGRGWRERWDWCRRCASTERVTHLDLGQDGTCPLSFLLQAVFIRMQVVMDPRP
ncbi:MAG: hypothetical protein WAK86_15980 [Pseudonocardiaceae bacterium]